MARATFAVMAWLALAIGSVVGIAGGAAAEQLVQPPKPIPSPPIPAPAQLGPPPKFTVGNAAPPARPVLSIPEAAELQKLPIPAPAQMTAADPADPTKPPPSATTTGPTAMVSPGGNVAKIEQVSFTVEPGSAALSAAADATLKTVAKSLADDAAARLEVRVFTPSKTTNSQSNARRLSLARYLAIRELLTRAGVAAARIDGRPLVSEPSELNPDRIELYIEH